jgi:adenosylmethionine-8-amino-7-oxononanoate aminotransferase
MSAPPLAHLGHWYVSLPVFMGPVLLLVIALKIQTWREQRHGPDQSGKRSTVTTTHGDHGNTTITVTGPLDYPALLEIETELGKTAPETDILLDLRRITETDQEAAWSLCDAISRAHAHDCITALIKPDPVMQAFGATFAEEGVELVTEE